KANDKSVGAALLSIHRGRSATFAISGRRFHAPVSLPELLALRAAEPDATLLAGGTDLGLKASRDRNPPASIVYLGHIPELNRISETETLVTLGAAVTYADMLPVFDRLFPSTVTYLTR